MKERILLVTCDLPEGKLKRLVGEDFSRIFLAAKQRVTDNLLWDRRVRTLRPMTDGRGHRDVRQYAERLLQRTCYDLSAAERAVLSRAVYLSPIAYEIAVCSAFKDAVGKGESRDIVVYGRYLDHEVISGVGLITVHSCTGSGGRFRALLLVCVVTAAVMVALGVMA